MSRHVTADAPDPRTRFALYRLCECPECGGTGKTLIPYPRPFGAQKCPACRGEGLIRQCVAECETPEAVGVALVTCAREGEWTNADGDPCAFGLLDREGEKGQKWLVSPWLASPRNVSDAGRVLSRSKKPADRG